MANDIQDAATSAAPVLQSQPAQSDSSSAAQPAQSANPPAQSSGGAPVLSPMSVGSDADSDTPSDRAANTSTLLNNAAVQAKGFVPGLVNGSLVAVHNGEVGDKGAVSIYHTDDLKAAVLHDPISYSVYDGSTDQNGTPIASKRVLTPDGKVTMYDYYLKQTEATKQLLKISAQHQAEQAHDALEQAKKEVLTKSVEYDYAKSLDKDGNPVYEHRTIDADGKTTKYDAFVATERAERQLVTLQAKFEAAQKPRKAAADVAETQQRTKTSAQQESASKQEAGIRGQELAEKQKTRQVQTDWDAAIKEANGDPAQAAAIMKQKSPDSWSRMAGNEALAQQREGTTVTTTDPLTGEKVAAKSQPRLFTQQAPPAPAIEYTDGGNTYHIPPAQEQAFLKIHPKAQKGSVVPSRVSSSQSALASATPDQIVVQGPNGSQIMPDLDTAKNFVASHPGYQLLGAGTKQSEVAPGGVK